MTPDPTRRPGEETYLPQAEEAEYAARIEYAARVAVAKYGMSSHRQAARDVADACGVSGWAALCAVIAEIQRIVGDRPGRRPETLLAEVERLRAVVAEVGLVRDAYTDPELPHRCDDLDADCARCIGDELNKALATPAARS